MNVLFFFLSPKNEFDQRAWDVFRLNLWWMLAYLVCPTGPHLYACFVCFQLTGHVTCMLTKVKAYSITKKKKKRNERIRPQKKMHLNIHQFSCKYYRIHEYEQYLPLNAVIRLFFFFVTNLHFKNTPKEKISLVASVVRCAYICVCTIDPFLKLINWKCWRGKKNLRAISILLLSVLNVNKKNLFHQVERR